MNTEQLIKQYASHTGNLQGLHFKRVGNNIVDVFSGEGFAAPTRLRLMRGVWSHVTGPKLSTVDQQAVVAAL